MNRGSKDIALELTFLEVISSSFSNRAAEVDLFSCDKQEKKEFKKWRIRASIPVPLAC